VGVNDDQVEASVDHVPELGNLGSHVGAGMVYVEVPGDEPFCLVLLENDASALDHLGPPFATDETVADGNPERWFLSSCGYRQSNRNDHREDEDRCPARPTVHGKPPSPFRLLLALSDGYRLGVYR